jgi:MazG nucleotide pyrophosphohydrolase domain
MELDNKIAVKIAAASRRIGKNLTLQDCIERVREELGEVQAELNAGDPRKAEQEMGDLLLSVQILCAGFPWLRGTTPGTDAYNASARKIAGRLEMIEADMAKGVSRTDAIKAAKAAYP